MWETQRSFDVDSKNNRVFIRFLHKSDLPNNANLQSIIEELKVVQNVRWSMERNSVEYGAVPNGIRLEKEDDDWVISRNPFIVQTNCKELTFDSQAEMEAFVESLKKLNYEPW